MADFKYVCHFLHIILFFVLILNDKLNCNYLNGQQQSLIEGPIDTQAKIGDQILLKCRFKNLKGEPQWCIDDFCLGVAKKDQNNQNDQYDSNLALKGRPRYRIVGDKSKGEFNLLIEPVQLQDNMYFYCMATAASETIKAVKSRKVFLTVLTYPQSLILDNPVHVSLNKPSSIQCIARQSRPPVKILIAINGQLIKDETKYKTEIIQLPIKSNNNMDEEFNTNFKKRFSHSTLQLISPEKMKESYYDTITNLTVDDITMRMDGQTVECFAYSFMNNINNVQMLSLNQNRFNSNNKNLNVNLFQNNVMSTKSIIQVDYAPEVNLKMVSSNRLLKEEDVISLICETKATPPIQSYKWYIGKNYLEGVTDQILNLKLRKEMHMQKITCEASNTVASVKASLKLNILYKPSFVKGTKSYMLIDKSACNKPLTLDCQVNSNPVSNITWFRRKLSRNYLNRFYDKSNGFNKVDGIYHSLFGSLGNTNINMDKLDEMFVDEPIGTGPTYTIASFNCANLLENVKNRTSNTNKMKKYKMKYKNKFKLATENPNNIKSSSTTPSFNQKSKMNHQIKKRNLIKNIIQSKLDSSVENNQLNYSFEDIDYDDDSLPIKSSSPSTSTPSIEESFEYENNEDYINNKNEYDEFEDDQNENDVNSLENKQSSYNEYDDFGIYFCEATNKYPNDMMIDYHLGINSHKSHRYIKINPIGAPILRAMPSALNSLAFDEITTLMMKSPINNMGSSLDLSIRKSSITEQSSSNSQLSDSIKSLKTMNQILEIPVTIGSPITLTCLIEPLPSFKKIIWLKPNGQLIPNSIYTSNEKYNDIDSFQNNKFKFNFKVKYENLTNFNSANNDIDGLSVNKLNYDNSHIYSQLSSNQNGVIVANEATGLMRSILYIKNVRKQDLGIYKCKSINSYGRRTVMILLREKTFIDKLSFSGNISLIALIIFTSIISILFIAMFMCIVSKKIRRFCCCCCCKTTKLPKKENELLSHNMQCDINSDKTINEWLVSSKLSNDTGNNSLINAPLNNNTTKIDVSSCNSGNTSSSSASSKTSKSSELISTTPTINLRHEEFLANCSSSLLNDDLDDQQSFIAENSAINENSKKEFETNSFYQSATQLNKYFSAVTSKVQKPSPTNEYNQSIGYKTITNNNSSTKNLAINGTLNKLSSTLRPTSYKNGNFNAKISACSSINFPKTIVTTPLLNNNENSNTKYMTSLFNQKTLKTNQQLLNTSTTSKYELDLDKDYYENNTLDNSNINNSNTNDLVQEDFNKLLKDNTYRLSDLFNELSPSLISTNSTNNSKMEAAAAASSAKSASVTNGTLNRKSPSNPSTTSSFPNPIVTQTPPLPPSRQTLIQAVNSNNLNKFPNPFANINGSNSNINSNNPNILNSISTPLSSKTSKFYNNFYRTNQQIQIAKPSTSMINNDQCKDWNV